MAYRDKKVIIAITSCKRLHLLRRVLYALSVCCEDIDIVDEILFFDDSSSEPEREVMKTLLEQYFPQTSVQRIYFNVDSFPESKKNYRHAMVLNVLRNKLIEVGADFYLHLEDDYQYVTSFKLSESIDVLMKHEQYAYVCHYQNYKRFPSHFNIKWVDNFWEWYYDDKLPLNCSLFKDDIGALQEATLSPHEYVPGTWIMYINWPHFSLRPGVHDVHKLLTVGEYCTDYDIRNNSVEFEFALRWVKKYKMLCVKSFYILNLAPNFTINSEPSAYNLTYEKDPDWN